MMRKDSLGHGDNNSRFRGLRILLASIAIGFAVLYCSDRSIAAIFHTPSGFSAAVNFVSEQLWPARSSSTPVTPTSAARAASGTIKAADNRELSATNRHC